MRILVTGATGHVGSWAALALADAGHDVRLLVRNPAKAERVFAMHGRDVPEHVVGDVTDAVAVSAALDDCDGVLHAAAQVGVSDGPSGSYDVNVAGVHVVVGEAIERGLDPILYTSSVSTLYPPTEPMLSVDSPLGDPGGAYGRSKVAAERWVREQQTAGAPVTSVMIGGVMGPRQPTIDSGMRGIIAAATQVMVIPPGGIGVLDVRDVAALMVAAAEPGRGPRRYLAGGPFLRWGPWTDLLGSVLGRKLRRVPTPAWTLTGFGRALEAVNRYKRIDYPMNYEAALAMTSAVPTNDSATLADLGIAWRDPGDTLRDAARWLLEVGELQPEHAPALVDG